MEEILKYFPNITDTKREQIAMLARLYESWNNQINVISRKDMTHFYERHVLHSLAIAKYIDFVAQTRILDVGTGGGFPGIPLAIMFPQCHFTLVDSIGKKIRVVQSIADSLMLKNVQCIQERAERLTQTFDFAVSRAVTDLSTFAGWVWDKITPDGYNARSNGIIYLKGGDLRDELSIVQKKFHLTNEQIDEQLISQWFADEFFETKKIVALGKK